MDEEARQPYIKESEAHMKRWQSLRALNAVEGGKYKISAYHKFMAKLLSSHLKEHHIEMKRQWAEMSEEQKRPYIMSYEAEKRQFSAALHKYKLENKKEDMKMPKLMANNTFVFFWQTQKITLQSASESWKSMTEGERAEWKARWLESKVKWLEDLKEWKVKNDGLVEDMKGAMYQNTSFQRTTR